MVTVPQPASEKNRAAACWKRLSGIDSAAPIPLSSHQSRKAFEDRLAAGVARLLQHRGEAVAEVADEGGAQRAQRACGTAESVAGLSERDRHQSVLC
jgi:hypothetical protein